MRMDFSAQAKETTNQGLSASYLAKAISAHLLEGLSYWSAQGNAPAALENFSIAIELTRALEIQLAEFSLNGQRVGKRGTG